jgi:hypothetical protein
MNLDCKLNQTYVKCARHNINTDCIMSFDSVRTFLVNCYRLVRDLMETCYSRVIDLLETHKETF